MRKKLKLFGGHISTEWVTQHTAASCGEALNEEVTRLTAENLSVAIKAQKVLHIPSLPAGRPVALENQKFPSGMGVTYLYQPGELKGGRHLESKGDRDTLFTSRP